MSGIEVAGLVLAVLPLFISALEDYNEGLDPIKAFWSWEAELPKFIRKLRNQHVHYEQILRTMLAPITTEGQLAEMIENPSSVRWKDDGIGVQLEDKLAESYKAYLDSIQAIEGIMKAIARKLNLPQADTITRNELEALVLGTPRKDFRNFEFTRRIKFGMSRKKIKSRLDELDECIKELERFTDKSERLEPYRVGPTLSPAKFERIRQYADTLHRNLRLAWNCSCRTSHRTYLQLQQRINDPRSRRSSGQRQCSSQKDYRNSETCFMVLFSGNPWPGEWRQAEIRFVQKSSILALCGEQNLRARSPGGRIRFADSNPALPDSNVSYHATPNWNELPEVKSLCAVVKQTLPPIDFLGFCLDDSGILRGAYPVEADDKLIDSATAGEITLKDMLLHPPLVDGFEAELSGKERRLLALTVASTVLQLSDTPWLNAFWGKEDIVFLRTNTHPGSIVDVERPYVAQAGDASQDPPSKTASDCQDNVRLLKLGVLLLELYFGQPIEKYRRADDLGSSGVPNEVADLVTAQRWFKRKEGDLSAAFQCAIKHCMKSFADPSTKLSNADCVRDVLEQVVLPLQDELWQFTSERSYGNSLLNV
ncbi:MAG: hypothetical protein M1820_003336 [Bogoriella megaspora]|nr:MAG: hypothetical protein M1820_003336 [Bogoriella megaspora]